jgi:hypothetical protein
MAVYVINGWLLLQAAQVSSRKLEMARVYIGEHMPKVHSASQSIHAADATPLEARETVLARPF